MKNNILIIVIVTVVAIGVIAAVILASVLNSTDPSGDSSDDTGYSHVTTPGSDSPGTSEPPDNSSDDPVSDPHSSDSPGSSDISDSSGTSDSSGSEAQGIIAMANSLIGVPFAENGSDPDGFDNSGFVYYVLRENGYITCPRGTEAQSRMGTRLDYNEIKDGDLVFFCDDGSDEVSFGGIYVGGGKMIACLMPGTLVREVDITTDYYRSHFFGGVSLT